MPIKTTVVGSYPTPQLLAERRERLEVNGLTLTNNIHPGPLYEHVLPRL